MKVRVRRATLDDLGLGVGKRTRLRRLLYEHGPGNGTLLLLPIDQGLEHGPRDFFENPESLDPDYQLRIAREGGYSGIVFQVGLASKYMRGFEGTVPLILKLNGKTEIPDDSHALSPCIASVEDAVRLGADAVGYTLYVGSPAQPEDFVQFMAVREEAERFGMPVIIWAYPRGEAIKKKGGRDSLYAIEYAARVTAELGADVVKVNMPVLDPEKDKDAPKPYNTLRLSQEEAMERVVRAAGRTMVLVSGGSKISDADLMEKARIAMDAGATGLIFGRNVWQRPHDEALRISKEIRSLILQYPA
ncbi:MAG: class I fructose-bisphosphate aldolase [Candidatus Methylomirabilales bacterium]